MKRSIPFSIDYDQLFNLRHTQEQVAERFAMIYQTVLSESLRIKVPEFEAIGIEDLKRLFELYDYHFFGGLLGRMIKRLGDPPVEFRLSNRMTRSAGKTTYQHGRRRVGWKVVEQSSYEITVSSFLLFQAFQPESTPNGERRPVAVAGVICSNRLEALLRIFEHELLHLAEFLATGRSSCSAQPFRTMSRAIFGHEASVHTLMTPVELAASTHSIALGDKVAFAHAGIERLGFVSRITKRATVLVVDRKGQLYSDGNRYLGFLVPLNRLKKV